MEDIGSDNEWMFSPVYLLVLQTPDFRNSEAADEIRQQMKLLMDLYKQMAKDAGDTHRKFVSETQHSTHDSDPAKENQDGKQQKHLQPRCSVEKPVQPRTRSIPLSSYKKPVASQLQGSYIVGGSAFGWNFITFSGSKPIYYGVTKEDYRSRNNTLGTRYQAYTLQILIIYLDDKDQQTERPIQPE
ncbi:hypothetical protein Prudu_007659 [Prunus dulcis]|uniref:Uncharacterized protein n=1 Tax=Prunus dulcis TaxID=3755 RepID=A0A4Y1R2K3_PRUDU|nr:hypothetical protein Prudu_007659 [Prunus dulcis]